MTAALSSDLFTSHDLRQALLDGLLPGGVLFCPVFIPDDPVTLTDLAHGHLSSAVAAPSGKCRAGFFVIS